MNVKRIVAITFIFIGACLAWVILGTAVTYRTHEFSNKLNHEVTQLWGSPIVQKAPTWQINIPGTEQMRPWIPEQNNIRIVVDLEHRRKGLFWYATYKNDFHGSYVIENHEVTEQKIHFHFQFPNPEGTYESILFAVDGETQAIQLNPQEGIREIIHLKPGQRKEVSIQYSTRGLNSWHYLPPTSGNLKAIDLSITTNFTNIDYSADSLSASKVTYTEHGATLEWQAEGLLTQKTFGLRLPQKLNPGPIASRITYFAPVCLLFFFVMTLLVNIHWKLSIHPMHYLFIAAGFFVFHLSFAYLVDVLNIHVSFIVSTLTTLLLVNCYLRAALGENFPWKIAGIGQIIYLILFSYSFFIQGFTGLIIMIGSVLTLAFVMAVTAKTDWSQVFQKPTPTPPPLPQ